jgi:hypothetical protein
MVTVGDRVLFVQNGVHGPGYGLAVVDVHTAVFVNVKTQEPIGAFPDVFHVPKAAAVLFYHRLGKLPYLLGDLHKNSSIQQERVGIAPHSLVKLLSIDPIVAQFFPFCKGKIKILL